MVSIAANVSVSNNMKTSIIKIYSYENKVLKGTIYNPFLEGEQVFHGAVHLLILMDSIFDHTCPQPEFDNRTFAKSWKKECYVSEREQPADVKQCLAVFNIRVIFRQNASWQGIISRPTKGDEANFRSVLEMLFLIDSALNEEN